MDRWEKFCVFPKGWQCFFNDAISEHSILKVFLGDYNTFEENHGFFIW